jgi:hypothetical protein
MGFENVLAEIHRQGVENAKVFLTESLPAFRAWVNRISRKREISSEAFGDFATKSGTGGAGGVKLI